MELNNVMLMPGRSGAFDGIGSAWEGEPTAPFGGLPPSRLWSLKLLNNVVEEKDGYTVGHCRRVQDYARRLGEELGLKGSQLQQLLIAAAFHDIGKVGIVSSILNKPGPLDHFEWQVVYMHPQLGLELWQGTIRDLPEVGEIIRQHHERWDGTGYPQGLAGTDIIAEARILHVVDAYDAMVTDRPYRPDLTEAQILRELQAGGGSQFWPEAALAFIELVEDKRLRAA